MKEVLLDSPANLQTPKTPHGQFNQKYDGQAAGASRHRPVQKLDRTSLTMVPRTFKDAGGKCQTEFNKLYFD